MGEGKGTISGVPEAGFKRNWWSDCHECYLESFLVWYTTEDSFIIGFECGKKWRDSEA